MASAMSSMEHSVTANPDALRFGLNNVKSDIVPAHPLQSQRLKMMKDMAEMKRSALDLTYGSAFSIRRDFDAQILSRFGRPLGQIPSSKLGLEAFTGGLDELPVEDYMNLPQDSETFRAPDFHHAMEVSLGLSKGPVYPSY